MFPRAWRIAATILEKTTNLKSAPKDQNFDAPIFKLNEDILLRIFTHNAPIDIGVGYEMPPAHIMLKRTSQVCVSWRDIILASPTLWGRVLNISYFYGRTNGDRWAKEVMRRTAQAPLHVKSLTDGRNPDELKLIHSILTEHWGRIRSLDLITLFRPGEDGPLWAWEMFQQPAPMLEAVHLHFIKGAHEMLYDPQFSLFGDRAPLLHTVRIRSIPISVQASWLFNLRSLALHWPFQLDEILNAFARMPDLEIFVGYNCQASHEVLSDIASQPKVNLPRLTSIELWAHTDFQPALHLLDRITPSQNCCLSLHLANNPILESNVVQVQAVISRYSQNYFTSQIPTRASLYVKDQDWRFMSLPGPFYLSMSSSSASSNFTASLFLDPFKLCFQQSIILELHISEGALSFSDPNLKDFVSSLDRVETLEATACVFASLPDCPKYIHQILPSLRTIQYIDKRDDPPVLWAFLQWRQAIGIPIHTVILLEDRFDDASHDFSCLDQVAGLRVVWENDSEEREYICGSGYPERLVWQGPRALSESAVKKSIWGRLFGG